MAQLWKIHLPMWEAPVQPLVQEDPTCLRAVKPQCHNHWACAPEPALPNDRPLQWEAPQQLVRAPLSRTTEKPSQQETQQSLKKKKRNAFCKVTGAIHSDSTEESG